MDISCKKKIKVLVTGSNGFIGKNLTLKLNENDLFEVSTYTRQNTTDELRFLIGEVTAVVHLAGENRPITNDLFYSTNVGLTEIICDEIKNIQDKTDRKISLVYTSSIQALLDNDYGRSKLTSEELVANLSKDSNNSSHIFRLPGVFGKWCKPNYNSVVATFCNNVANGLDITIHDTEKVITLIHIDDLVRKIIDILLEPKPGLIFENVEPEYRLSLGELADKLEYFSQNRRALGVGKVGAGFDRLLYSTFLSYLPTNEFTYSIPQYTDDRGTFVEMLKTIISGQISFFTSHPGITRGEHYHHTKSEKFLVISGKALFQFRDINSQKVIEFEVSNEDMKIVETIPGWVHSVTNICDKELVVAVWANEVFDKENPDTIMSKVKN